MKIHYWLDNPKFWEPYNKAQRKQLHIALEQGIKLKHIHYFWNPKFDWKQMREIRLGLVKRLDVSHYADIRYDAEEMKSIRMSLRRTKQAEKAQERNRGGG